MQRLAQMQGGSLDTLNLTSASAALSAEKKPLSALAEVCVQLAIPKPLFFDQQKMFVENFFDLFGMLVHQRVEFFGGDQLL